MSWSLVSLASVPRQPWRNGGGMTRELLAWPSPSAWQVRLSVADVQAAGPFSRYDAVERWFAVLEGAGVVLRIGSGQQQALAGTAPLRFDGATAVHCELVDGPTCDFNLMAPPGRSRMQRVRGPTCWQAGAGMLLALYTHSVSARIVADGEVLDLPAGHLAWQVLQQAAGGSIAAGDALWMEAMP